MNVLGIDPGGTTGVVILHNRDVFFHGQFEFPDVLNNLEAWMKRCPIVAVERYVITPQTAAKSRQYEALYIIGAVFYVAHHLHRDVKLQAPSDAKSAFPNEVLRDMGWFGKVKGPHARDALRHALLADRFAH